MDRVHTLKKVLGEAGGVAGGGAGAVDVASSQSHTKTSKPASVLSAVSKPTTSASDKKSCESNDVCAVDAVSTKATEQHGVHSHEALSLARTSLVEVGKKAADKLEKTTTKEAVEHVHASSAELKIIKPVSVKVEIEQPEVTKREHEHEHDTKTVTATGKQTPLLRR